MQTILVIAYDCKTLHGDDESEVELWLHGCTPEAGSMSNVGNSSGWLNPASQLCLRPGEPDRSY